MRSMYRCIDLCTSVAVQFGCTRWCAWCRERRWAAEARAEERLTAAELSATAAWPMDGASTYTTTRVTGL